MRRSPAQLFFVSTSTTNILVGILRAGHNVADVEKIAPDDDAVRRLSACLGKPRRLRALLRGGADRDMSCAECVRRSTRRSRHYRAVSPEELRRECFSGRPKHLRHMICRYSWRRRGSRPADCASTSSSASLAAPRGAAPPAHARLAASSAARAPANTASLGRLPCRRRSMRQERRCDVNPRPHFHGVAPTSDEDLTTSPA